MAAALSLQYYYVLLVVLGKPVGVTPTVYFNLSKGTRSGVENVVQEMKSMFGQQMAEMNAKILELQQQMMKKETEAKDSCLVKNQGVDDDVEEVLRENVQLVQVKNKAKSTPRKPAKLEATDVPKQLKNLHKYARHALTDGMSIQIQVDNDVFGHEHVIFLFFEDINHMCALEAISASCICIYIWHLYKECESACLLPKFRFVNPYKISHNPNVGPQEKASIIHERMIGTLPNQLLFLPCNVGWHWILMVIDPHNETVYVLDPLSNEAHVEQWKGILTMAHRQFNMTLGKRGRLTPLWNVIKCQQQPDGLQCGFYVMRYMRDIIENEESSNPIPMSSLVSEGYYSKEEIDEVRKEWANFVDEFTE